MERLTIPRIRISQPGQRSSSSRRTISVWTCFQIGADQSRACLRTRRHPVARVGEKTGREGCEANRWTRTHHCEFRVAGSEGKDLTGIRVRVVIPIAVGGVGVGVGDRSRRSRSRTSRRELGTHRARGRWHRREIGRRGGRDGGMIRRQLDWARRHARSGCVWLGGCGWSRTAAALQQGSDRKRAGRPAQR